MGSQGAIGIYHHLYDGFQNFIIVGAWGDMSESDELNESDESKPSDSLL